MKSGTLMIEPVSTIAFFAALTVTPSAEMRLSKKASVSRMEMMRLRSLMIQTPFFMIHKEQ